MHQNPEFPEQRAIRHKRLEAVPVRPQSMGDYFRVKGVAFGGAGGVAVTEAADGFGIDGVDGKPLMEQEVDQNQFGGLNPNEDFRVWVAE